MNLRRKTLVFVVLSVAALVGATLWVIDGLVMRELSQVEHEEMVRKVADVRSIVQGNMAEYGESFADWTEWDDLARFLATGEPTFLESNVSLSALADQIHAEVFVVARNDGEIVYSTQVNPARDALEPCEPRFLEHVTARGLLRPGRAFTGLLSLNDATYIVSSRPIHTTAGAEGPAHGRLVTAERLDRNWIQHLEGLTFLTLGFSRLLDTPIEPEELAAREELAAGADAYVAETGDDHISSYARLPDIYGKPAMVLHVSRNRAVLQRGREIVSWTMITLLSGGFVLCLFTMWAIGRGALRPLQRLLAGTHKLQRGERSHVIVRSGDEFQTLAHDFNRMADVILEREEALRSAHEEIARLFDGMAEAIVAFGPDGSVTGRASRKAHEVFRRSALEGASLRELLYPGADDFDIEAEAFQAWLTVAFTQPVAAWQQVRELAPRAVVLRAGTPDEAHLVLDFRAVEVEGEIHRVILLARDETEKHKLLREQAEREDAHERQMSAMRRLLAGGAQVFVSFVHSSHGRLDELSSILLGRPDSLDSADIELLFRHAHTLKGEARVFDNELLEQACRELEDLLDGLRTQARTGRASAVPQLPRMRELLEAARAALEEAQELFVSASPSGAAILDQMAVRRPDIEALDELTHQIAQATPGPLAWAAREIVERLHSRPFGEICAAFAERVPNWAEKLGKRVLLEVEGREVAIPPALARRLSGALTHLLRNSVSHGIEAPEVREARGKDPFGRVRLVAEHDEQGPRIVVEDDGAGLDLEALAEKARSLGRTVAPGEERSLIFVAGLSTARVPDEYSGRGVGMGAVQSDLAAAGYEIELESRPGEFTRFTLQHRFCALEGAQRKGDSSRERSK
ncbi:MAG: Hpt domain-containing protein [Planctomycetes bacterium]|nr:Hpt domain-containing protein [Planctomycetota bacterium]